MVKLYDKFKDKGFEVLAVNIGENREKVKEYADKKGMLFKVLLDTKGEVAIKYRIRGTPAHFLINKNGKIKAFAIGFKDLESKTSQNLIQFMIDNNN